jgi:hypothetical protein
MEALRSEIQVIDELENPTEEDLQRSLGLVDEWTGMEKDAMEAVVRDFNRSQSRIWVEYQSVSLYQQKILLATAGGDPPDIAGLLAADIADFAEKNALIPLDERMRGTHLVRENFLPTYWDMGVYHDRVWAVASVPIVVSLHWNKDLFAKAGLDPERPPRTIAELDEFAENSRSSRTARSGSGSCRPTRTGGPTAGRSGSARSSGTGREHHHRFARKHPGCLVRATPNATTGQLRTSRARSATSPRRRTRSSAASSRWFRASGSGTSFQFSPDIAGGPPFLREKTSRLSAIADADIRDPPAPPSGRGI